MCNFFRSSIRPKLLSFGAQSIIVSLDLILIKGEYKFFKRGFFRNYHEYELETLLKKLKKFEFGELQIMSVDCEGTLNGLDINLIKIVKNIIDKPIIFCGGANSIENIEMGFNNGAFAIGVGRMFTLHGPFKAVLIDYPKRDLINKIL